MGAIRQDDAIGKIIATATIAGEEYQKVQMTDAAGNVFGEAANPVAVDVTNFPESLSVTVANFPETQPISGAVSVSNFPETQTISGSVAVSNWPESQSVNVTNFPVTQAVSGDVSISNFPETQPVSGSVSVSNFPETQAVSVSNFPATQPVSGSVSVSNFPATQAVRVAKADLVTGTISSAGQSVSCDLGDAQGVGFATKGSYAGVILYTEVSFDQTDWYACCSNRIDQASNRGNYFIISGSAYAFYAAVAGFRYFRVRVQAISSGSITITLAPIDKMPPMLDAPVSSVSVSSGLVTIAPSTNAGYNSLHTKISLASTNATSVKASGGNIGILTLDNTHATDWRYVKIYNKASAPTVGTDTPVFTFGIPPKTTREIAPAAGIRMGNGIAYAITALPAATDTTAIGADEVIVNIAYV